MAWTEASKVLNAAGLPEFLRKDSGSGGGGTLSTQPAEEEFLQEIAQVIPKNIVAQRLKFLEKGSAPSSSTESNENNHNINSNKDLKLLLQKQRSFSGGGDGSGSGGFGTGNRKLGERKNSVKKNIFFLTHFVIFNCFPDVKL